MPHKPQYVEYVRRSAMPVVPRIPDQPVSLRPPVVVSRPVSSARMIEEVRVRVPARAESSYAPYSLQEAPARGSSDYTTFENALTQRPSQVTTRQESDMQRPQEEVTSQPVATRSRLLPKLHTAFVIIICSVLGMLAADLMVGQIAIAAYGVTAVIFRIKSQTTFTLALLALVCVPVLLLLKRENGLAENFAVYAFLLLVVGVVTATIELRQDSKVKGSYQVESL